MVLALLVRYRHLGLESPKISLLALAVSTHAREVLPTMKESEWDVHIVHVDDSQGILNNPSDRIQFAATQRSGRAGRWASSRRVPALRGRLDVEDGSCQSLQCDEVVLGALGWAGRAGLHG